jgi:hypothetical protein
LPGVAPGSGSMAVFEYIFRPDGEAVPDDAPRPITAATIQDAAQILFLRELAERGVAGTLRLRPRYGHDIWTVWRFVPRR